MIRILLCSILLWGCGANYQLRKADRALKKAETLGAEVRRDTTWNKVSFIAPSTHFETTLAAPDWQDTIYIKGKDSIQVKILVHPATAKEPEKVFVSVDCPEQEIKKEIPVAINTDISAGYSLFDMIVCAITFAVIGYVGRVVQVMIKT